MSLELDSARNHLAFPAVKPAPYCVAARFAV